MKSLTFLMILPFTVTLACNRDAPEVVTPDPEIANQVATIGDVYAGRLLAELIQELNDAIEFGGPAYAVDVCHLKAIPMTDSIGSAEIHSYDIKRTSAKYRNPENAPDEFERMAIDHYTGILEDGKELPEKYIQEIRNVGKVYYYFYKPIMVSGVCLNCHGNPENIDPFVYASIREHYPDDHATGYHSGDFRGLIRIKIRQEDL